MVSMQLTVLQEIIHILGAETLLGIQSSVTFVRRIIQVDISHCSPYVRSLQKHAKIITTASLPIAANLLLLPSLLYNDSREELCFFMS